MEGRTEKQQKKYTSWGLKTGTGREITYLNRFAVSYTEVGQKSVFSGALA